MMLTTRKNTNFTADHSRLGPNPQNFIAVEGHDDGISSRLNINLGPYIKSYKDRNAQEHQSCRETLEESVFGLAGSALWEQTLDAALNKAVAQGRITTKQIFDIKNSPVSEFMMTSFVEIVKNSMDETVLAHYQAGKNPLLIMQITIHLLPESITLTITDNGRGFPQAFLKNFSTPEKINAYIRESGSDKKGYPSNTMAQENRNIIPPALFGGMGLGLRILTAQVTSGDVLEGPGCLKPKYEKPNPSMIDFSNCEGDSGAKIKITTSNIPLKEKNQGSIALPAAAASITLSRPPTKRSKTVNPSPSFWKENINPNANGGPDSNEVHSAAGFKTN